MDQYIVESLKVLTRLLEHQLYVKAEKCAFHASSVSFLGYIISANHIKMDPEKLQFVVEVDASNKGLGVVPSQRSASDGRIHPCAFLSPDSVHAFIHTGVTEWQTRPSVTAVRTRMTAKEPDAILVGAVNWQIERGVKPQGRPGWACSSHYWRHNVHGYISHWTSSRVCLRRKVSGRSSVISLVPLSVCPPGTNGQTECMNQELETCLRCLVSQNQMSWSDHLPWIKYAHNALPTAATRLSPFQVVFGFVFYSAHTMVSRCRRVWAAAHLVLLRGQARMKKAADRRRETSAITPQLAVGGWGVLPCLVVFKFHVCLVYFLFWCVCFILKY
ncbi:hypothetical protein L3Q82_012313 [Scortum barcoo]|uniref:Uncharacterized protein n=1 Tax=Scortum barcoo TaxID=214431 RepID=A0ACB8W2Q9_9TELE|nr:hypothetical protein L3Q82_012313 [Scortum barcoo]